MSIEQLTRAAISLPENERRELIRRLLATLPAQGEDEIDPQFMAELLRRDEEMESGRVEGLSHEEVMARARRALG